MGYGIGKMNEETKTQTPETKGGREMPKIKAVKVDLEKECEKCGEAGATQAGMCLKCIAKLFKGQAIGFVTIQQAKTELCELLDGFHKEIDEAYVKADGDLTVSLGVKMAGTRMAGEIELTVSINFVESRIKHAVRVKVNEKQMSLPGI